MSEYASVVERARKAFAAVSRLEGALAREPSRRDLQTNLAASMKLAKQTQDQLYRLSESARVEVCNYRLLPEATESYGLPFISQSMLEYQNLFTQIHDAKKNGPKNRAVFGHESIEESMLEFAYSYSGSLGMVFLAKSERDLLSGKLDASIEALYQVLDINSRDTVRDIAKTLGNAVVKRVHDWSNVNVKGGFAADVRWNRSDGRQLGEVIARPRMEKIVEIIEATSEEEKKEISAVGFLIGAHLRSKSFHFVVPNGEDYRGHLAPDFSTDLEMTLGHRYRALIRETKTITYATEKVERKLELLRLTQPPKESNLNEMLD